MRTGVQLSRAYRLSGSLCLVLMALGSAAGAGEDHTTAGIKEIAPRDAIHHVGATRKVCGTVFSAVFLERARRQPTLLNINQDYPAQPLTLVIYKEDRDKFAGPPEKIYEGKRICVIGRIDLHRNKPQIVVNSPSMIEVVPGSLSTADPGRTVEDERRPADREGRPSEED